MKRHVSKALCSMLSHVTMRPLNSARPGQYTKEQLWRCFAGAPDDEAIELAFSKKKIEERKAWLAGFEPGTYLDQSVDQISYSDFVNKVRHELKPI